MEGGLVFVCYNMCACVCVCVCVCSLWKQSTMMKKKFVSFAEQKLRVSVDETEITAIHNA